MKFSAILLIASIASNTHAAGNLRSGINTPDINESEKPASPAEGVVLIKEHPNNRNLDGGNERMENVLAAESGGAGALQAEEQRAQATREKLLGEATTTAADTPSFDFKPKEGPTEPVRTELYAEEAESYNTDYGINIVGGDASDPNEFPYYGKSILRHPIPNECSTWSITHSFLTWAVSRPKLI
jgi:hypothetical protein